MLESRLEQFAQDNAFGDREFSYKKCDKSTVRRYIGFLDIALDFIVEIWEKEKRYALDFRCMIFNKEKNRIQLTEKSKEEGFYKLYHHFLIGSLKILNVKNANYELHIADLSDAYPFRTDILTNTLGNAMKNKLGNRCILNEIERGKPREYRVHQLADVILGLVVYKFKGEQRPNKQPLLESFERRLSRKLDYDFRPSVRPFNVWTWASRGQTRWNKGAGKKIVS